MTCHLLLQLLEKLSHILSIINNIGNSESASGHKIKFYLSEDTEITISDTLLTSYTYGSACIAGSTLTCIPAFTGTFGSRRFLLCWLHCR